MYSTRTESFIEDFNFKNRGFWDNMSDFFTFMLNGCNSNNNIVAQMSSVSVFAFIDKEGIVTENQKYVDELAVVNEKEDKVILDLAHDPSVIDEEEVYKFEGANEDTQNNMKQLKALGLAMMMARNPKEDDTAKVLEEIFTSESEVQKQLKEHTGFHFHYSMGKETDFHQDCVCTLARVVGHSQHSFKNFEFVNSFWNMVPNQELQEGEA